MLQPPAAPPHGEGVQRSMAQDLQGLLSTLGSVVRSSASVLIKKEITLPLLLSFSG